MVNLSYVNGRIDELTRRLGLAKEKNGTIIYELPIGDRLIITSYESDGKVTNRIGCLRVGNNKNEFYWEGVRDDGRRIVFTLEEERLRFLEDRLRQEWLELNGESYHQEESPRFTQVIPYSPPEKKKLEDRQGRLELL